MRDEACIAHMAAIFAAGKIAQGQGYDEEDKRRAVKRAREMFLLCQDTTQREES